MSKERKMTRYFIRMCYSFSYKLINNFREIIIILLLCGLIYQKFQFDDLESALKAQDIEREELKYAMNQLTADISEEPPGRERDLKLLELQSKGILVGGERDKIKRKKGDVCPEEYINNQNWPYQFESWRKLDCDYGQNIEELVTIYFDYSDEWERLVDSIRTIYPKIRLITNCNKSSLPKNVICLGKNPTTSVIKRKVTTKYLLYGRDLDIFTEWADLERSVRLLSDSDLSIFGVGGAVRNKTGFWTNGCFQLQFDYYRLQLEEGYRLEHDDCMVCDYTPSPTMILVQQLQDSGIFLNLKYHHNCLQ